MESEEAIIRSHLKSDFEFNLESRIKRTLEFQPHSIIPHHHFTFASSECIYLYRDGYFMATAMVTQALNEAIIRFIAERNSTSSNQDPNDLVDLFTKQNIVTKTCSKSMKKILRSFRNDFHHLNPSISEKPVQDIAKRNIEDINNIEKEIFDYTFENGKVYPKQKRYWDIRADGTVEVMLRFG